MKRYIFTLHIFTPHIFTLLLIFFSVSFSAAQPAVPVMPDLISADDKQTSMADIIKKVMATPQTQIVTENTEKNVESAIEGTLVFEEQTPEVNKEVVDAIDPKTKRYPPRIRLDFKEFPLVEIVNTTGYGKEPDIAETNLHQTDLIVSRIRQRTKQDGIEVVFRNRTAVLTGTATAQRQAELAEIMLRFEPGIDAVENKLKIKQ